MCDSWSQPRHKTENTGLQKESPVFGARGVATTPNLSLTRLPYFPVLNLEQAAHDHIFLQLTNYPISLLVVMCFNKDPEEGHKRANVLV